MMFTSLHAILRTSAAIAVVCIATASADIASAATGPWIWKDVSKQIPVRADRPVWALAYLKPYWYFTDGQVLAKTGHVWRTDGTNTVDITSDVQRVGLSRVDKIVSDDTAVFFIGPNGTRAFDGTTFSVGVTRVHPHDSDGSNIFLTEGARVRTIAVPAELASLDWKNAKIAWTGASWMILVGKTLVRYDGVNFQNFGHTRDYFVTLASDGRGTLLLGGAMSNDTLGDNPATPLLAKLVHVTETVAQMPAVTTQTTNLNNTSTAEQVTTTDTITQGNSNGIAFWTWFTPNQNALRRDQMTTYTVGAWSAYGVAQLEIHVNGALRKRCDIGTITNGNQSCAYTLVGSEFASGARATVAAKVTSVNGAIGWTRSQELAVTDPVVTIATEKIPAAVASVSTWTWIEPNLSGMDYRGSIRFKAQANTTEGINRIDLYVNGVERRMCDFARAYGIQSCDLTLSGLDYPVGTNVILSAEARAASGDAVRSSSRAIAIRDNLKDAGRTPSTITTWMSPVTDNVKSGDTVMYFSNAQDTDGVATIELLADEKTAAACNFTNAYATVECSAPISTARYPDVSVVNMTTRVTDAKGNVTLSESRYFTLWR